nr:MAG TPA: hypothetical protein [Caudoviricetes sp.]
MGPQNFTFNHSCTVGHRRCIWHFRISKTTLQQPLWYQS